MDRDQSSLQAFSRSLDCFANYPINLIQSSDFPYALKAYYSFLESAEDDLFRADIQSLLLQDLLQRTDGTCGYKNYEVKGIEELRQILAPDQPDPLRRFCFIQSLTSRDALRCSREQLSMFLSRHQVMPRFLDLVFTFISRMEPHRYTSFRCEDDLSAHQKRTEVEALRRSGVRIQHCFNLLGFEYNERENEWLQRQVAAYHSFDVLNGNVVWTILKGNDLLQGRMREAATQAQKLKPDLHNDIGSSFRQSLQEHLLLLQWSAENWTFYIESLEKKLLRDTAITRFNRVRDLVDDVPARYILREQSTLSERISQITTQPGKVGSITEKARHFTHSSPSDPPPPSKLLRRGTTGLSTGTQNKVAHITLKDEQLQFDQLATPTQVQDLSDDKKNLQLGISIIDQNKRVLTEVMERYVELKDSRPFKKHIADLGVYEECYSSITDFSRQVKHLIGDLENYQGRLKALLYEAEQAGQVYDFIFQERSNRITEFFATSAEASTEKMERWTQQMHKKTMSMHLITIFTLIFLPGTFVATMFSSGIIEFGAEGSSGFGRNLGDWKVRLAGLKLFFLICMPLLLITLGGWTIAYFSTARSRLVEDELDQIESLPTYKDQQGIAR